jgi:outer membrane protein assembly factor BamB/adenine/guanine phosphoribosyltransferase-like PRPP-binding protein
MHPHEDLRKAIQATVLKRAEDGAMIASVKAPGTYDAWLFDFRALMLQPKWLNRYAEIFWQRYAGKLPFQVAGLETAGIPLVSAIVMKSVERGTPVNGFYIRKSRKRTGLMKYIEGTLTDEPVLFVDDLANSGQSIAKQVEVLRDAKVTMTEAFVLLAFRNDEAYEALKEKGVALSHLFTLRDFALPMLSSDSSDTLKQPYEVLWRHHGAAPSFSIVVQKSAPVADEKYVYFGSDDGIFRALDQRSGEVVWEFKIGPYPAGKAILSTPALHGETVYFGAYDGNTYALDANTGAKKWSYERADWVGSSPCVAPDLGLVYIGLEYGLWHKHGGIAALDARSGEEKWHQDHAGLTHGSPLYIREESLVVIGSNDGFLYAYDAQRGTERWRLRSDGAIKARPAYDPKHRLVVFGTMNGTLYGVSVHDAAIRHVFDMRVGIYSTPLVHENTIYAASIGKQLVALDAHSWRERWKHEASGRIFASPVMHNGSLWLGSNSGKLCEIDPNSGKLRSFFQVSERIVNAIASNGVRLFVPTIANEVYCLKRVATEPESS